MIVDSSMLTDRHQARAEGITQIIFSIIFLFGPSRNAVPVFRASQVRFFNLSVKRTLRPYSRLRLFYFYEKLKPLFPISKRNNF